MLKGSSKVGAKEKGIVTHLCLLVPTFSQLVLRLKWKLTDSSPYFLATATPSLSFLSSYVYKVVFLHFHHLFRFHHFLFLVTQVTALEGEVRHLNHKVRAYQEEACQISEKVGDIERLKDQKEKEQQWLHDQLHISQQQVRKNSCSSSFHLCSSFLSTGDISSEFYRSVEL